MQVFTRDNVQTHCVGAEWPEMLGTVSLGESFVVETIRLNPVSGPIGIAGVQAGDSIAIHIEDIRMRPPYLGPNGGPFFEGIGDWVPLEYKDGQFIYPQHFRLQAKPSIGNLAILPKPTMAILKKARNTKARPDHNTGWRSVLNDPRTKYCHQDCQALTPEATMHIKAQVDGAGVCVADVHGYIGQGELAFGAIEVNADVQLRVDRSEGWLIDWPLIETADEIMVCCAIDDLPNPDKAQYVDLVREAYRAMREVVAHRIEGTVADANPIVAAALDLRNCAIYGLGNFVQKEGKTDQPDTQLVVVGVLPKHVFVDKQEQQACHL